MAMTVACKVVASKEEVKGTLTSDMMNGTTCCCCPLTSNSGVDPVKDTNKRTIQSNIRVYVVRKKKHEISYCRD